MTDCKSLLKDIEYKVLKGSTDRQISSVVYNSDNVEKDSLFICIVGAKFDAHEKAAEAAEKGAAVLVVSREVELPADTDVTVILVEDTRYAMAFISAAYFGHPADRLKVIGVTGTKGKTTTTYLVKSILEHAGHKVGLVGTIEAIIGEKKIPANNTTPESYILQKYFREMADAGCDMVVMEVSSQGLMQHRTQGFTFELGIFTNIEPDHIGPGEHKDFEDYMRCKGLLFKQCRKGIVNCDDAHWEAVTRGHTCELETYGFSDKADLYADDVRLLQGEGFLGVDFRVKGLMDFEVQFHSPGRFSVYNALTAIAICRHFDIPVTVMQEALKEASVKGRIELIRISKDYTLMIDYAHNAMALESLLTTLKEYEPKRLVCLFGCGGNRSKLRRYEMGEVSGKLADLTVITSDNPRFEKPQDIIDDIKTGIGKTDGRYIEIIDRREAIAYVIKYAKPGDVIVLAGKGHEDYQEIEGKKYPMDERDIIADVLAGRQLPPANADELAVKAN
ncbi:MAG: UDP-N-acetylmuramoyl-L-alanyl-D-glutamate--2,6-diaminopimelate ligase [Lachnospiraceae bacterium]